MSDNSVPLSILSSRDTSYHWAKIGIGKNILSQSNPPQRAFWIVVIERATLTVVYNQLQLQSNVAPNLGSFNTPDYILCVATMGLGLDMTPSGAFFQFLDANGAGRALRRVEQLATQFGCGSLGTYAYALCSVLGNLDQPGFEACNVEGTASGPYLTVQLMPIQVQGKTVYTPVELSNA